MHPLKCGKSVALIDRLLLGRLPVTYNKQNNTTQQQKLQNYNNKTWIS